MKTEIPPEFPAATGSTAPLEALLQRSAKTADAVREAAAPQANRVLLGTLKGFDEAGRARVQIDGQAHQQVCAGALAPLREQDAGRRIALGFAGGEAQHLIILGLLHETAARISSPQHLRIEQNESHTIIEASETLELRCGEAVVLLRADGRIELRGVYITSHASAGQRIRGGSVQIN